MRHFSVTEANGGQCSRVNSLELLAHEGKLSGQRRGNILLFVPNKNCGDYNLQDHVH